jgi:DNA-binding IclR family transcriptional regulator
MDACRRKHATRETVVLGVPGDHDVLFMEKFFQRGGGTTVTKVEGRVPIHCSASGKVLLAFGDPALLEQITESKVTEDVRNGVSAWKDRIATGYATPSRRSPAEVRQRPARQSSRSSTRTLA